MKLRKSRLIITIVLAFIFCLNVSVKAEDYVISCTYGNSEIKPIMLAVDSKGNLVKSINKYDFADKIDTKYASFGRKFDKEYLNLIYPNNKPASTCPSLYICSTGTNIEYYTAGGACENESRVAANVISKTPNANVPSNSTINNNTTTNTSKSVTYCSVTKELRNSKDYRAKLVFYKDDNGNNKFKLYKKYNSNGSEQLVGEASPDKILSMNNYSFSLNSSDMGTFFSNSCSSSSIYFKDNGSNHIIVQTTNPGDLENGSYSVIEAKYDDGSTDEQIIKKTKEKLQTIKVESNGREGCDNLGELKEDIRTVWNIICIIAPILVILLGSIDFAQAILAQDDTAVKKATGKFTKRIMAAVILFFVPFLVNLLFSISGLDSMVDNVTCDVFGGE